MKRIASILLVGIMVLVLAGCGTNSTDAAGKDSIETETVKKEPLEALKDEFKKGGLAIGENQTVAFEMVGATAGQKFKINDELIEIYYYDESKLTEEGKKLFEQAKTGNISISGINISVIYKNNFVLARADNHKNKEKILEVFNNFKY